MSNIRLRLKKGDREIEIEGSKAEVDDLLRTWWTQSESPDEPVSETKREKKASPARRRVRNASAKQETEADQKFDPIGVANSLKESSEFPTWEKHVLHQSNLYNKVALVTNVSEEPLTSGQIAAVLEALDVKGDVGNVSNTLKRNSGKFLASSARRAGGTSFPRYKLTSQARTEFKEWLSSVQE